jgi:polysaccharide pyruvyl transferase WcaK-like protein
MSRPWTSQAAPEAMSIRIDRGATHARGRLDARRLSAHVGLMSDRVRQRARGGTVAAYVGGDGDANLGDEAILRAVTELLPAIELMPLAYPDTERRLERLRLSGTSHFDAVVLSGGTLINPHFQARVQFALDAGLPAWAFGTGVGGTGFGMTDDVELQSWAPLLSRFKRVAVRGPRSAARLEAIGVQDVHVIGDPALALRFTEELSPSPRPPCLALNVARPDRRTRDAIGYDVLEGEMIRVVGSLVDAGWTVEPIAMHRADVEPTDRVLRGLGSSLPVPVAATVEEFFGRVAPCSLMLAVRLHAAVLACCVDVPPLLVGYRDKCSDFMESLALGELLVPFPLQKPDALRAGVALVLRDHARLRASIAREVSLTRARLAEHARILQRHLCDQG